MLLFPTLDKLEHDNVIDVAYDTDSLMNSSLQLRIKFSDVYVKIKTVNQVDLQTSHQIAIVTIGAMIST